MTLTTDGANLPAEVDALLRARVHSYEHLEALLLLHRTPGVERTAADFAGELRLPLEAVAEALESLVAGGVIAAHGSPPERRYRGLRAEFAAIIARLAETYGTQRLEVIKVMNANAIERMRTGAMRAFADAFVIGKRGTNG